MEFSFRESSLILLFSWKTRQHTPPLPLEPNTLEPLRNAKHFPDWRATVVLNEHTAMQNIVHRTLLFIETFCFIGSDKYASVGSSQAIFLLFITVCSSSILDVQWKLYAQQCRPLIDDGFVDWRDFFLNIIRSFFKREQKRYYYDKKRSHSLGVGATARRQPRKEQK